MRKKKKTSSNLEQVKEWVQDPKKRAIVFFAFYFVFFFVLISMVRSAPVKKEEEQKPNHPEESETKDLNQINYQFIYTIVEDEKTTVYSGKAYHSKESFTEIKDGKASSYYKLGDHYFKKENEEYLSVSNPYIYSSFFDMDNLEKLLDRGTSEVDENTTTYQIPVVDLLEVYDPSFEYDGFLVSSIPDDVIKVVRENGRITKVEYSLNHMIQYDTSTKDNKINSLTITLEFLEFGTVEDFNIEN